MATFKENLKQTFANFKTKYIGNVPEGVTVAQINQHLTVKADKSYVEKNTGGTAVDLSSYTVSTPFITPNDGYVSVYHNATANNATMLHILGSDGNEIESIIAVDYNRHVTFVKKGMKLYGEIRITGSTIKYTPLV